MGVVVITDIFIVRDRRYKHITFFSFFSGDEFRGFSLRRKRRPMVFSLGLAKFVALAMNIAVKRSYGLPPLCELIC